MKMKKIKQVKLHADVSQTGGCVERCVHVAHIWYQGVDLGPGLVCSFCY